MADIAGELTPAMPLSGDLKVAGEAASLNRACPALGDSSSRSGNSSNTHREPSPSEALKFTATTGFLFSDVHNQITSVERLTIHLKR